jgi:hypothetical protein
VLAPERFALAFVAVAAVATQGAAQDSSAVDVRVLALRALEVGSTIRIVGRDVGMHTGAFQGLREGAAWLREESGDHSLPTGGIDSVWVERRDPSHGAFLGGLLGGLVGFVVIASNPCQMGDTRCLNNRLDTSLGITLGGTLLGALFGNANVQWSRRYP